MNKSIISYFQKTAKKRPNKIAFIDEMRQSTFFETMAHAESIGTSLVSQGKQRAIAIMIDKNCNCIDCILGALYANDFYVVIDVKSPKERIESILHTLKTSASEAVSDSS